MIRLLADTIGLKITKENKLKGFKDSSNKFHPITQSKGVRKSRDQSAKIQGVKITRKARVITGSKLKDVSISEHYWGFETSGGKISKLRLGNWSDAGWHWDGDENDIIGYMVRFKNSDIQDEWINGMEGVGITYKKLKPLLMSKVKDGSWLYELSGDNTRWHFHQDIDEGAIANEEFEGLEETNDYTEKELEKISDELWRQDTSYNFEDFEEDFGDGLKKEMKDMIKDSNTFKEFFEKIQDEDFNYQITENYVLGVEEKIRDGIFEAVQKLKKSGEISVTKEEEFEMKKERTEQQIASSGQQRLKRDDDSDRFGNPKGTKYDLVRFFSSGRSKIIHRNVSDVVADLHTNDPRTRKEGVYFDGFRKVT